MSANIYHTSKVWAMCAFSETGIAKLSATRLDSDDWWNHIGFASFHFMVEWLFIDILSRLFSTLWFHFYHESSDFIVLFCREWMYSYHVRVIGHSSQHWAVSDYEPPWIQMSVVPGLAVGTRWWLRYNLLWRHVLRGHGRNAGQTEQRHQLEPSTAGQHLMFASIFQVETSSVFDACGCQPLLIIMRGS